MIDQIVDVLAYLVEHPGERVEDAVRAVLAGSTLETAVLEALRNKDRQELLRLLGAEEPVGKNSSTIYAMVGVVKATYDGRSALLSEEAGKMIYLINTNNSEFARAKLKEGKLGGELFTGTNAVDGMTLDRVILGKAGGSKKEYVVHLEDKGTFVYLLGIGVTDKNSYTDVDITLNVVEQLSEIGSDATEVSSEAGDGELVEDPNKCEEKD